jgi:hypothetical protein
MKHTFCYFMITCLLCGFISCDTQQRSKYADRHGNVLDSIYTSQETTIDAFFEDISWIAEVAAFKEERKYIKDTIIWEENLSFEFPEISIFLSDTLQLTISNSIIVNKNTNLISESSFTETIPVEETKSKLPFTIAKYTSYGRGKVNSKYVTEPTYKKYYEDKNMFDEIDDSITAEYIKKMIPEEHEELQSISKIKYLIVLNDILVIDPLILSKDVFQSGYIMSTLQLYDIKTKTQLGQDVLLVRNQSEMTNPIGKLDLSLSDDLYTITVQRKLRNDLIEQKNVRVYQAVNMSSY